MSLQRGAFGIEYTTPKREPGNGAINILLIVIAIIALISLGVSLYRRGKSEAAEVGSVEVLTETEQAKTPFETLQLPTEDEPKIDLPSAPDINGEVLDNRPAKVRTLLLRLAQAEKAKNYEMVIQTIERIRAESGATTADIDDKLARRAGELNWHRLFVLHNAQWVKEVSVRKGSNASLIASEHGSTLESLRRLNPSVNLDTVREHQKLKVLETPRFRLNIHRRSRIADLLLNGKFFKRYYLIQDSGKDGRYKVTKPYASFWRELGVVFSGDDRLELEMLMPKDADVTISEF